MCGEDFFLTVNPMSLSQEMLPYIQMIVKTTKQENKKQAKTY